MDRRLFLALPFAAIGCRENQFSDRNIERAYGVKRVHTSKQESYYLSLTEPGLVTNYIPGTLSDAGTVWNFKDRTVLHNGYVGMKHSFDVAVSPELQAKASIVDSNGLRTAHDAEMSAVPREHLDQDLREIREVSRSVLGFIEAEEKTGRSLSIYSQHKQALKL